MSKIPKIRSAYDGSRVAVVVECGPSMAKASFRESTDVNSVVERYAKTGVWSRTAREPMFGDVTMIQDFHTALTRVREAEADVERLPGRARELYREDPGSYLDMVRDASSREDLVELGLLEPKAPEPIVEPKPASEAEPAEPAAQ